MTDALQSYQHAFSHLRKGVTKFGPAPHKLILLLAVIREIEAGRVVQNRFAVTDALIEAFMTVWSENVHSGHTATFALPFFICRAKASGNFMRIHSIRSG